MPVRPKDPMVTIESNIPGARAYRAIWSHEKIQRFLLNLGPAILQTNLVPYDVTGWCWHKVLVAAWGDTLVELAIRSIELQGYQRRWKPRQQPFIYDKRFRKYHYVEGLRMLEGFKPDISQYLGFYDPSGTGHLQVRREIVAPVPLLKYPFHPVLPTYVNNVRFLFFPEKFAKRTRKRYMLLHEYGSFRTMPAIFGKYMCFYWKAQETWISCLFRRRFTQAFPQRRFLRPERGIASYNFHIKLVKMIESRIVREAFLTGLVEALSAVADERAVERVRIERMIERLFKAGLH